MGTGGQGRARVGPGPLRPVDGPDTRHTVLEAVSPEAGHVIVHYLHLAAAESWVLKEMPGQRAQEAPAKAQGTAE